MGVVHLRLLLSMSSLCLLITILWVIRMVWSVEMTRIVLLNVGLAFLMTLAVLVISGCQSEITHKECDIEMVEGCEGLSW